MAESTKTEAAEAEAIRERGMRKSVTGIVASAKMAKTIAVRVDRLVKHRQYKKFVKRHTTYYAHDENNEAGEGDTVEIMQARPMSKLKRWRLVRITRKAVS